MTTYAPEEFKFKGTFLDMDKLFELFSYKANKVRYQLK